jgi:hypothetical protein
MTGVLKLHTYSTVLGTSCCEYRYDIIPPGAVQHFFSNIIELERADTPNDLTPAAYVFLQDSLVRIKRSLFYYKHELDQSIQSGTNYQIREKMLLVLQILSSWFSDS